MQKDDEDNNRQESIPRTLEINEQSVSDFWLNGIPIITAVDASHEDHNYTDEIFKVLSEIELPSPAPVLATSYTTSRELEEGSIRFYKGETSGTKRKAGDNTEGNIQEERELKRRRDDGEEARRQRMAPEIQNITARGRTRNPIHEKIRALHALVPNSNKRDQASMLDDTIRYIKSLQMQLLQAQCMGFYPMPPQVHYISPVQQQIQPSQSYPYGNYLEMRAMTAMGPYGPSFPMVPPFMPSQLVQPTPMTTGIHLRRQPRLLPFPRLQVPLQPLPAYSITPTSDTVVSTTSSLVGSGIPARSFSNSHMPMTTLGLRLASSTRPS